MTTKDTEPKIIVTRALPPATLAPANCLPPRTW